MTFRPTDYSIRVKRVGQFYKATVEEIPFISEYSDNSSEAYDLIINRINSAKQKFDKEGKTFPEPHNI